MISLGSFMKFTGENKYSAFPIFPPENVAKTFPAYLTPLSWRFSTASHCVKSIGGETTYMVSHPAAAAPLERLGRADQTVWNHLHGHPSSGSHPLQADHAGRTVWGHLRPFEGLFCYWSAIQRQPPPAGGPHGSDCVGPLKAFRRTSKLCISQPAAATSCRWATRIRPCGATCMVRHPAEATPPKDTQTPFQAPRSLP